MRIHGIEDYEVGDLIVFRSSDLPVAVSVGEVVGIDLSNDGKGWKLYLDVVGRDMNGAIDAQEIRADQILGKTSGLWINDSLRYKIDEVLLAPFKAHQEALEAEEEARQAAAEKAAQAPDRE